MSSPGAAPDDTGLAEEYRAATEEAAWADRTSRTRLRLRGRAPEQVLAGLVSGKVPAPLSAVESGVWSGRAEGSALLTPKGRMVTELRLLRWGAAAEDGFLLDLPAAGGEATLAHLRRYVPPRLAVLDDVSEDTAMLTVLGPAAAGLLAAVLARPGAGQAALEGLAEGDLLRVEPPGEGALTVVATAEVATPALDLLGPAGAVRAVASVLSKRGARPTGAATWETLRVEAGRPAWGTDMDDATIPVEAGIHPRVVDYGKGCFTGQEVLVRIRDRGHVNRHLRGLRMGDGPPPAPGTLLFRPGDEARPVGHVTSAVPSPRFGEVVGLAYVRREVQPPAELRLADPQGERVRVHDLDSDWRPAGGPSDPLRDGRVP